jgi:hypothetical protein
VAAFDDVAKWHEYKLWRQPARASPSEDDDDGVWWGAARCSDRHCVAARARRSVVEVIATPVGRGAFDRCGLRLELPGAFWCWSCAWPRCIAVCVFVNVCMCMCVCGVCVFCASCCESGTRDACAVRGVTF